MSRSFSYLPSQSFPSSILNRQGTRFSGASLVAPAVPASAPSMTSQPSTNDWSYDFGNPTAGMMIDNNPGSSIYNRAARNADPIPITSLAGVGIDPSQYLRLRGYGNTLATSSPQQYLSPPGEALSHAMPISYLSSNCGSLMEDTATDTATSSRLSESYQGSNLGSIDMAQANSQDSFTAPPLTNKEFNLSRGFREDLGIAKQPFDSDGAIFGIGCFLTAQPSQANIDGPASPFPGKFASAMEPSISLGSTSSCFNTTNGVFMPALNGCADPQAQHQTPAMERSMSNTSTLSNSSLLSVRAKNTLRRQNSAAKRVSIQPRAPALKIETANMRSQKTMSFEDGSETDIGDGAAVGKKEIAKTRYARPKHPKLKCDSCDIYPEGFRGEHELRRHIQAKHTSVVKKWTCCDPHDSGAWTSVDVIHPLRDCKQCSSNKQYGAYYNAAAHLRRTHFKKKAPRKGSHQASPSAPLAEDEANLDWPHMSDLKPWMKEVIVPIEPTDPTEMNDDGENAAGSLHSKSRPKTSAASFAGSKLSMKQDFGVGDSVSNNANTSVASGGESIFGFSPDLPNEIFAAEMGSASGHGLNSSAAFLETHETHSNLVGLDRNFVGSPSGSTTITAATPSPYHLYGNDICDLTYNQDSAQLEFMTFMPDSNAFL